MQLTPAREYKRLVRRWIVWRTYERDASAQANHGYFLCVGRIKAKQGNLLITERHERVDIRDAWVLSEEPTNWPQWEWGSYRKLPHVQGWRMLEVTA